MSMVELDTLSRTFATTLLEILLRSSALFLIAAFVILFFRSRSAEIRHFIWRGLLYGLLLLPALRIAAPPVHRTSQIPMKAKAALLSIRRVSETNTTVASKMKPAIEPAFNKRPFPWMSYVSAGYVLVAAVFLLRLLLNFFRLKKFLERSEPLIDPDTEKLWHEIWLRSLCPSKPQIRISSDVCVPMAVGICDVSILLPSSWKLWAPDKLQAVLIHEMAHVRRKDPATAFLVSLTQCLFWIHPLVYWLRTQLAVLAEEACDQAVLLHMRPERYSQILIEFVADVANTGSRLTPASPVAVHGSRMKKRIERIFSLPPCPGTNTRRLRPLLTAMFLPALYLTATTQLRPEQVLSVSSRQQAEQLESDLRDNPDNLTMHSALMIFYSNEGKVHAFTKHLLWVIDHHPEAPVAELTAFVRLDRPFHPLRESLAEHAAASADYEEVKGAWERSLITHSDSAEVALSRRTLL